MLLTKQQKYLLAVLTKLGCAEQRQLAALLQKTFAFSSIDDAVRVTNACVRQMQVGGLLQIADGIVTRTGEDPSLCNGERVIRLIERSRYTVDQILFPCGADTVIIPAASGNIGERERISFRDAGFARNRRRDRTDAAYSGRKHGRFCRQTSPFRSDCTAPYS